MVAGVAGLVKQLPGAVGYVELAYALQNHMPVAVIRNKAGNYIAPSIEGVSLAAETDIPADTRVSITDTGAELGYPISGFTWLILYKNQKYSGRKREKALALVEMVWWMIHEGQEFTEPLHYAPLPAGVVRKAEAILASVTHGKETLIELSQEMMQDEIE